MPLLAQFSPPSPEAIGILVLGLVFLTRWLWDYNRSRREDAAQHEPRSTPPLHEKFATKAELAALSERVDSLSGEIKHGFERLDEKRSVSIAGLHKRLETAVTEIRSEVRSDIVGVHERVNEVLKAVSKIEGKVKL